LYVYRWENSQSIKPALYKGLPIPDLEDYLQDKHDGGVFLIIIRRGEIMLESGLIAICPLPSRKQAFEAFQVKYGW
jgi:hypothetical protein